MGTWAVSWGGRLGWGHTMKKEVFLARVRRDSSLSDDE